MAVFDEVGLKKDLEKYLYTFADAYCREARYEITKMAKNAIEQFYKDYGPNNGEPWFYKRTDDLKDNSYKPYYHNNGKRIYGGVRITSEDMSPYNRGTKSETDPFEVAKFAYDGWHGHPAINIHTTPPLEMIRENMKNEQFLHRINKNAERVALEQDYEYLKFN